MTILISIIMTKCTQGERILIYITCLFKKIFYKIPAAYIMNQVREEFTAKRIITKIRHYTTPISKRVGIFQFFISSCGELLPERRNKCCIPVCINDRLVGKYRITKAAACVKNKAYSNQYSEFYTEPLHNIIYSILAITVPAHTTENRKPTRLPQTHR